MRNDSKNEIIKDIRRRNVHLDNAGNIWSDEDKEQLIDMFEDGVITDMAISLQRTEQAVFKMILSLGLYGTCKRRVVVAKTQRCLPATKVS